MHKSLRFGRQEVDVWTHDDGTVEIGLESDNTDAWGSYTVVTLKPDEVRQVVTLLAAAAESAESAQTPVDD